MASIKYAFDTNDFVNHKVNSSTLTYDIHQSSITIALDYIDVVYIDSNNFECDVWFKVELSNDENTTLSGVIYNHSGIALEPIAAPTMADGRPLVRADTRPLDHQTYFTMAGDSISNIGDGNMLRWDFSNDEDLYDPNLVENGPTLASGIKAKRLDISFHDPIYTKDGSIYFFDAPWGCYCEMYITVPAGGYYPNPEGSIPASALGLSGDTMYAYATKDVFYGSFLQKHYMYSSCPMGDELNSEGCQVDATPAGWYITGLIFTAEDDNTSKGYASLEMYRFRSVLLPGCTI
jgi:hypothetical protein